MIRSDENRSPLLGGRYDTLDCDDIIFRLSAKAVIDYFDYITVEDKYPEICKDAKRFMTPLMTITDSLVNMAKKHSLDPMSFCTKVERKISGNLTDPFVRKYIYIMMNCESIVETRNNMMMKLNVDIINDVCGEIIRIADDICLASTNILESVRKNTKECDNDEE